MTTFDPGQVLVIGFQGTDVPTAIRRSLASGELGGLIFFARNIESAAQLHEISRSLEYPAEQPPLLAIDQEGGRVARLGAPVLKLPPMRALADVATEAQLRDCGELLGRQLAAIGLTMDFAPVLDVDSNPANPVIGDRSFATTPDAVADRALAFAAGLRAGGVLPCGKHFPGHGDTDVDSHLALPRLTHDRARLDAIELAPFRAAIAADLEALMTAHVLFDALDPELPATLSATVLQGLLRQELGYRGLIISDDLEMKAVADRWGVAESAVRSIEAGCDTVLVCSDVDAAFAARDALAARAADDASFRSRLADAVERSLALRRGRPPAPAPALDDSTFAVTDAVATLMERFA
jgi:beta-N-acetylhexosaminidase